MVVYVVFSETSSRGCLLMQMSQWEVLCNHSACLITIDQTQAPWQPLAHFPKQIPMTYDTGTISSNSMFISRDGCTVIALCY